LKQKHAILLLLAAFFVALVAGQVLAVYPDGVVNYTILKTETRNKTTPVNITAYGGNITWLRIDATQQTKRWQGFVGNMSGSLVLDDAANNTMYSWNLSNVTGEIYASTNCSLDWNLVSPQNDCSIDNYITGTGSDSASKTYTPSSNSNTYQILSMVINASSTCAAYPYVNSSAQSTFFENIILAAGANASTTNQTIYAATIDGATEPNGFNGEQFDYQMLVPANGTTGTVYCLYAEIN
jgi:hypothetical protein